MQPNPDFMRRLGMICASADLEYAFNPREAVQLNRAFGGSATATTAEDVLAKYGDEAAAAWRKLKEARAEFFAASMAHLAAKYPDKES